MSYKTIREEIKGLLKTVVGIGHVYDYNRLFTDLSDLVKFITQTQSSASGFDARKINAWFISRRAWREVEEDHQTQFRKTHVVVIRGIFSLVDDVESEKKFQDLLDVIDDKFRGSFDIWEEHPEQAEQAIQAPTIDTAVFGGILVHQAEFELDVEEVLQKVP